MSGVEFVAIMFVMTIVFVSIGKRWHLPYPIVLVLGGLALSFVPPVPRIHVPPETALVLFLPPLLYWEAVSAPTHAMRHNAKWLVSLAFGLVFVTAWSIAIALHRLVPGGTIAVALMLGAILAPTDAVAPGAIAERLRVPRNIVSIVQGESLLNDAAALALYGAALAAATSGSLIPGIALLDFAWAALGALAIGLAVGWVAVQAWRRINDPDLESLISIALPFVAYIPAARLGLSGVLAVVSAGLYVNHYIPIVMSPIARLRSYGYWQTLVFVTNALVFIVVGLALREAIESIEPGKIGVIVAAIVLVNVVVVVVRFAWVYLQERVFEAVPRWRSCRLGPKGQLVVAWSGLRGGVSLAIALAVPYMLPDGTPFPYRNLIILVTFSVILCTLLGGGLTLPLVIRSVGLEPDDADAEDERTALGATSAAALRELELLERTGIVEPDQARVLRVRYEENLRRAGDRTAEGARLALRRAAAEHKLFEVQRNVLIELRRSGRIDNAALRRLQMAVDLSEAGELVERGATREPG